MKIFYVLSLLLLFSLAFWIFSYDSNQYSDPVSLNDDIKRIEKVQKSKVGFSGPLEYHKLENTKKVEDLKNQDIPNWKKDEEKEIQESIFN